MKARALLLTLLISSFLVVGLVPVQGAEHRPSSHVEPQQFAHQTSTITQTDTLASNPQLQQVFAESLGADNPDYHAIETGNGVEFTNPAHGYSIQFHANSVELRAGDDNWEMALTDIGYGDDLTAVADAHLSYADNRLTYERGDLSEWYINSPRGVQQGFTLNAPPANTSIGELTLRFNLSGSMTAQLASDTALSLNGEHGANLSYSGLYAYDANQKTLPARLELVDDELVILVDDSSAMYPITIDPLYEDTKLTTHIPVGNGGPVSEIIGSTDISGNTIIIGYPDGDNNNFQGSAYIFVNNGGVWSEEAHLVGYGSQWWGRSVGIDGDTAIVGDYGSSQVDIFVRNSGVWSLQETINQGVNFGFSVDISGNTVLVGDVEDGNPVGAGTAYVYVRSGTSWSQQATLTNDTGYVNGPNSDRFGYAVALDDDTAVVSDYRNNDAVYIFVRNSGVWSQQSKLVGSHNFGVAVAISGDTLLSGVVEDVEAAYVYTRSGTTWNYQAKLTTGNTEQFALSVAIDGGIAIVGDRENGWAIGIGSVYVFARNGTSWSLQQELRASDGAEGDNLGGHEGVAIFGNTAIAITSNEVTGINGYVFNIPTPQPVTPAVSLSSSGPIGEGLDGTITANLSATVDQDVTVDVSFSGTAILNTDYTSAGAQIVIPAGHFSADLTLTGLHDTLVEGTETIVVDIDSVTNAIEDGVQQMTVDLLDNDIQPTISISPATASHNERNSGNIIYEFEVSLSNPYNQTVSVGYSYINGTATIADNDYGWGSFNNPLYFNSGDPITQTIKVVVKGDTKPEPDETFTISIHTPTNATIDPNNDTVTFTILNDDPIPTVTLTDNGSFAENGGTSTVTATLSAVSGANVTVDLAFSGDAIFDEDYNSTASQIVIPAGQLTGDITLTGLDDNIFEGTETVVVDIDSVTNADEDGTQQVSVDITDDDAEPTVSISPASISHLEKDELNTAYDFTVTLSNASTQTITVNYTTNDDTATVADDDYVDNDDTLTFNPGDPLTQTVTVYSKGDYAYENDEDFTVTLNTATNATIAGINDTATGTIQNNDNQPTVSISPADVSIYEGDGGTTAFDFTVTLSKAIALPVTVNYTTNDDSATVADSDYVDNDNQLVFNPGDPLTQTITVNVNGDTTSESDETFTVSLDSATNGTIDIANDTSTGTILNDDGFPIVTIAPASIVQAEGNAGSTAYVFTVTLDDSSADVVTVFYSTNDGTAVFTEGDYTDNDGSLVFNPGAPLTQDITVNVTGDTIYELDETFTVNLDGANNGIIDIFNDTGTGTIQNDDGQPTVSISPANVSHAEGDAGTTAFDFTVTLSASAGVPVTVNYTTNNGTATTADNDYVDNDGQLLFNPGDPLTKTITVSVNGDTEIEADETFTVNLNSATNATIDGANDSATGTIQNDDALPVVSISPASISQLEDTTFEFTVTLSEAVGVPVTVNYTTNDGTALTDDLDYVDNDSQLVFNPGNPLTQTITVYANDDTKFELDETFTVSLDSAVNATIDGLNDTSTGTIQNDDTQPVFTVVSTNVSQNEGNSGTTAFEFTVGWTNMSYQPLTLNYTINDGTATIANSDYVDNDGQLVVNPCNCIQVTVDTITVNVNGDTDFEPDEYFTLSLNSATNATIEATSASGTGIILNDDAGTPNDALVLFDPATSATGIYDSVLNSPNEFAYTNTPPTNTDPIWVMGDWNGDGNKTPGYFDSGAFRHTNDIGPNPTWASNGIWLGNPPSLVAVVSGRFASGFSNDNGNDCIGWMDSGTHPVTGDAVFSLKYWCDMTAGGMVSLSSQYLGTPLPDSGGYSGTFQFAYGDWDNDGLDEPGIRRGTRIVRSDTAPSEGGATYPPGTAQRWDTADGDGPGAHGLNTGLFVAGDWNGDGVDTWGVVYDDNTFYYRDVFGFNPGPYEFSLQTFTSSISTPRQVDSHHNATGGSNAPGPAGPTVVRATENEGVDAGIGTGGNFDTSQNVEAELSVSKAGNYNVGEVGLVGDSIVWTITVSNTGTAPANGVQITDNVPMELRVDDALSDNGTITVRGQAVIFTAESIGVGETAQFQVVTTILSQPESGTFANSVNVILPDGNGSGSDANLVASGTVQGVDGLPATGYAPKFRW